MTVFDATSKARTFNYRAGDVGFVPRTMGHYIENIGSTTMRVINVFNSRKYTDVVAQSMDGADTAGAGARSSQSG